MACITKKYTQMKVSNTFSRLLMEEEGDKVGGSQLWALEMGSLAVLVIVCRLVLFRGGELMVGSVETRGMRVPELLGGELDEEGAA